MKVIAMLSAASPVSVRSKPSGVFLVLLWSGLMGFFFGLFEAWTWQQAVEGSQVISGVVRYPAESPFLMYQVKAWTLLHQIPALFLHLGVSEKILSLVLSGFIGCLSFQALAVTAYSFCEHKDFAIGTPCFISVSSMYVFGTAYPVTLMGVMMTYGIVGLCWMTLALALHGTSLYRLGAWMLGLSVAVHPVLGLFGWMFFAAAMTIERKNFFSVYSKWLPFFIAGVVCSAASYGFYLWKIRQLLPPVMTIQPEIMRAFFLGWDGHRMSIALNSEDVWINAVMMIVTSVWLWKKQQNESPQTRFFLRVIQIATLFCWLGMLISWIPLERQPLWLISVMPGRLFSFIIFIYGAVIFPLADRYRGVPAADIFLGVSMILIVYFAYGAGSPGILWVLGSMLLSGLLLAFLKLFGFLEISRKEKGGKIADLFRGTIPLIFLMGFSASTLHAVRKFPDFAADLQDYRTDPLYQKIHNGKGLLLTAAEIGTFQLVTRRPILLDIPALDGIAYVPEAAQQSYDILKEVYGIDLLVPMDGEIIHRELWEQRTLEQWQTLAAKYHFTEIAVDQSWVLKLPFEGRNHLYALYRIPAQSTEDKGQATEKNLSAILA